MVSSTKVVVGFAIVPGVLSIPPQIDMDPHIEQGSLEASEEIDP